MSSGECPATLREKEFIICVLVKFITVLSCKRLSEILTLLLDGALQGLLAQTEVLQSLKSESPLLLPW